MPNTLSKLTKRLIGGRADATDDSFADEVEVLATSGLRDKIVLLKPTEQQSPAISRLAEFTKYQMSRDGRATAYVCLNYNCKLPTTEISKMLAMLNVKSN